MVVDAQQTVEIQSVVQQLRETDVKKVDFMVSKKLDIIVFTAERFFGFPGLHCQNIAKNTFQRWSSLSGPRACRDGCWQLNLNKGVH